MSNILLTRALYSSYFLIASCFMIMFPQKLLASDGFSGQMLKTLVVNFLANKGMESHPAININKKFPACGSPLAIFPMFKGWSTVEVVCTENGNDWKVLVRTRAQLSDSKNSMEPVVSGKNLAIVVTKSLSKGHLITEKDIQVVKAKKRIGTGTFRNKIDLIGRKLKTNISVGFPVRSRHLEPNWVISSGDQIEIVKAGNMFNVSVIGIALQNGQRGEKIKVKNISSEKTLVARIINEKKVSINANTIGN